MLYELDHRNLAGEKSTKVDEEGQDYSGVSVIEHNLLGKGYFGAFADGSSGTGLPKPIRTDRGAMISVQAAEAAALEIWQSGSMFKDNVGTIVVNTINTVFLMNMKISLLKRNDCLATVGCFLLTDQGGFAYVMGDGFIAVEYDDGEIVIEKLVWDNDLPAYPVYGLEGNKNFVKDHGGEDAKRYHVHRITSDAKGRSEEILDFSVSEGLKGRLITFRPDSMPVKIFMGSDGWGDIFGRKEEWEEIIRFLLDLKSPVNPLKGRVNRFLKEVKSGTKILRNVPNDDISAVTAWRKSSE